MDRWTGKVALVTGASAGIGAEIARQLVKNGMTVIGCARTPDKIEAISKQLSSSPGKLVAMKCDVRVEEEVKAVFAAASHTFGGVDVCVNNAGVGHNTTLLTGDTAEWRDMAEVNVIGVCVCTREFMQQLRERGVDQGHIFIISSMGGHRVNQQANLHFYSATNFAQRAIAEGVRQELREMKSNVKVTAISPGIVRTEFRSRMYKMDDLEESLKLYDKSVDGPLEAEDIASAVVYALSTPPRMEVNDILVRPTHQKL